MTILWAAVFAAFLAAEALTVSLTCIWFSGGALAALCALFLGGGAAVQFIAFVAVSFLLFLLVRPAAARYVNSRKTPTNVDSFAGRRVEVKERVDSRSGSVFLNDETWLARTEADGIVLEPGSEAVVVRVEGAKLIVRAAG